MRVSLPAWCRVGSHGGYTCGGGLKSQLADGVGQICRFLIASDVLEGNSLMYSLRSGCGGGPHTSADREDSGVFSLFSPMAG
jgi:hypothetical protein